MFLAPPPATILHGILALAAGLAKAKAAPHKEDESESSFLGVISEIATGLFADSVKDSYIEARKRLVERLVGVHEPHNHQLQLALARSAVAADILCVMRALPNTAGSGPLAELARKLGIVESPVSLLHEGEARCVECAKKFCEDRLRNLEAEIETRPIDPSAMLKPPAEDDAARLGQAAFEALQKSTNGVSPPCGALPKRVAAIFENDWANYLFAVFQAERTEHDPVYKLFLELRLDAGFRTVVNEIHGSERRIIEAVRSAVPQPPPIAYAPEAVGLFVGSDEDRDRATTLWLADRQRPLLICGPPGVGKSKLARRLLHHAPIVERFQKRRFYLRCDPYASAALLMDAIGREWFGLSPSQEMSLQVTARLSEAPAAVVLDNFEAPHAADRAASEELLRGLLALPDLWLIIGIQGEERPLGVEWAGPVRPRPLDLTFSRELFRRITGQPAHLDDPRLNALLREMDGVPHAIELLAHQVVDEDLAELSARWSATHTAMLRRGAGRENNIDAAYQLAIQSPRMNDAARLLLRVLSFLPAGLAGEDLSAVTDTIDGVTPLDAAATLKQRALAFRDPDHRLRMLAPLRFHVQDWSRREFAVESETDRARRHFLTLAERGRQVGADGGAAVSARLAAEYPNVVWAIQETSRKDTAEALEAVLGLGEFTRFTGMGDTKLLKALSENAGASGIASQARCAERLGDIALARSDHGEARQRFEEALPLYRQVGNLLGEAGCIFNLGNIARERSDHREARQRFEEALRLYRQIGYVPGEANCIFCLGDIARARSDHSEVGQRYEEALRLYRQAGSVLGQATCILCLGDIALTSDHGVARQRYEEALPLFSQVGDVAGEAGCIFGLGDIAEARSDHDEARRRYKDALPLYRQVGSVLGEANCILKLGEIASRLSDNESALSLWRDSLRLYERIPEPYSIGQTHRCLARIAATPAERDRHVQVAREAWASIDRPDLIKLLDNEFGGQP